MNMEQRELDEHGEQLREMSLAVKLAFSRVTSLLYNLKNDISEEAAAYQLQRIRNDVKKVLKAHQSREALKENRFPQFSELDTTSTTVRTRGNQNFNSQANISGRPQCLPQTFNGNVSYLSAHNEIVNGTSLANRLEENKPPAAKYHQQHNGTVSFFSSKNDDLCTSFSSSFRPMGRATSDVENCVSLGTIVEESRFQVEESDADSVSEEQTEEENAFFFLKSWSILLKDNDILLTGIKMNEKGDILVKNFVSKKVVSRKQKDTVKTLDGEFVLQGNIVDKNKAIPPEVKRQYFENEPFPRNWRQALKLWIELEEKKKKEERSKKKTPQQKKMKDESDRKRSVSPKKKMKDDSTRKRSISPQKKVKTDSARKRSASPKKKMKEDNTRKRSISPKKKMKEDNTRKRSISPKKKTQNVQTKKEGKGSASKLKSPTPSTSKQEPTIKGNKKNNSASKRNTKKNKQASNGRNPDNGCDIRPWLKQDLEKNGANENLENGHQDEHGPFSELLGDDSLMLFPSSSLTPNGLLGSIKKNVIKGRYTPPTSMFDNVYGTKSDNNSSVNTSYDDIGVKNNHVVKRMCKGNKKPKAKTNKSPKQKHIMEEDEAINEILRAAKSKTNTTPSIMKKVFSTEKADDSVNFSDLSDIEVG